MSKFAIRVVLFAAVFLLGLGRGFADIPPGPPPRPRPRPQPIAPSQPAKYQVVAFWRLSNLSQSLATIGTYVPFPVPAQEGLKSLLGDFYGVVNQTAPVDVVLALDAATVPNLDAPPPVAVAFSVSSVAETRRIAKARGVLNGATTDRASISVPFGGESVPCALFGATGPGKIVCSTNDQYVSGLAPLLLQANVPGAQGKDLYGEVMVSTFESIFSAQWKQILDTGALTLPKKLSMGDPQFDRAMTDVIQAVIREMSAVSKDLSILAVDVSLKADQIQFSLGYKMVGTQSAWARSDAESAATKPSGPPAAFLALPKQVTSASFARSDPKWGRQLVAMVLPVLDAFLAKDGLPEADRQAIKDLLQKTSLKDGLSFDVMGVLQNPATAKPAKAPPNGLFSHDHFLSSERTPGWRKKRHACTHPQVLRNVEPAWTPRLFEKEMENAGRKNPAARVSARERGETAGSASRSDVFLARFVVAEKQRQRQVGSAEFSCVVRRQHRDRRARVDRNRCQQSRTGLSASNDWDVAPKRNAG